VRAGSVHSAEDVAGMDLQQLDDLHKKQNENDEQNKANSTAAVIAESGSHAIAAKAEHQNQNEQKNKHLCFLRSAKFRLMDV
jgi:hypothetical protein